MGQARSLVKSGKGRPEPQGVTETAGGAVNFAIRAPQASKVWLLLTLPEGHPGWEIAGATAKAKELFLRLDPKKHHTGQVWHIEVQLTAFAPAGIKYMWLLNPALDAKGQPLPEAEKCIDPYARELDSPSASQWNVRNGERYSPSAVIPDVRAIRDFDWQGVESPGYHLRELIIYEAHVRGFTRNPDSGLDQWDSQAGTFLGFLQKIPYLLKLGINCVELLPVFEFDETACPRKNPHNGEQLCNYWGYSTVAFFVPMQRFVCRDRTSAAIIGFKTMVRELHRVGIEVILDVVFNHTAEGTWGENNWHSWKSVARSNYYLLSHGHDTNYTGCGNTMNANDPMCADWILACLRYWALDMRVDGFRFDLASALCRGGDGKIQREPEVIRRMSNDPDLKHIKLIAEPWDCSWPDGYLVGHFPSCGPPRWAEWNGKFRDTVRSFIKGDEGMKSEFATRISGSSDLFRHSGRSPFHAINFITAHDGFTLKDLVSYNGKHNTCNGEESGDDHNSSWNCGHEGPTGDGQVNHLRERQMRNMLVALLLGVGTPMMVFGDEYGRSQRGCNNGWCQDALSWFSWSDQAKEENKLFRFTRILISMRKRYMHMFGRDSFCSDKDIWWRVHWDDPYNYMCYVLHDRQATRGYSGLLFAFNAGHEFRDCDLPAGKAWYRLIDTNLSSPKDACEDENDATKINSNTYGMHPYSCIVLKCMQDKAEAFDHTDSEIEYAQLQQTTEHLKEIVRRRMSMELLPNIEPERIRANDMMRRLQSMSGLTMPMPVLMEEGEEDPYADAENYVIERAPSSTLLPLTMSSSLLPGLHELEPVYESAQPQAAPTTGVAAAASAAVAEGTAGGALTQEGLKIRFAVTCSCTNPGECVYVAGSSAAVGSWDPDKALACTTTAATFPVWTSEWVDVPPGPTRLEFKVVVGPEAKKDGKRWEGGSNRLATLPAGSSEKRSVTVTCAWGAHEVRVA
mmetsp:Transcript_31805/g.92957  ORF Transcript_31805/g.92957 Transcript_31805/m.92957 type:complete len:965 (+) Transcript_31805:121-3015(+)|eukprot:CAMPEP_0170227264 /NCGR_PEP_ID=MMETSP0116_2-20130129/13346_1 /TAXON_ID=400756 /ORGANISM="Durinskia baltica, Strain CSIRO CS-38" /LENGTH=964 /DNA_ID=CAMNT_0010477995 /DNA_START=24 /DNA_END=2918 /DNA_ORIENTATION=-